MFSIFNTIFKYKEKESPDKLGLFPEQVHVDAMPERRYLWTSRFLVIIASMSICFNMMLASALYVMLPQRSSSPQLFYIDHYFSQIERAQPMEINYPVGNLINEEHITNYIMLRYLITNDYDELIRRWVRVLTSTGIPRRSFSTDSPVTTPSSTCCNSAAKA